MDSSSSKESKETQHPIVTQSYIPLPLPTKNTLSAPSIVHLPSANPPPLPQRYASRHIRTAISTPSVLAPNNGTNYMKPLQNDYIYPALPANLNQNQISQFQNQINNQQLNNIHKMNNIQSSSTQEPVYSALPVIPTTESFSLDFNDSIFNDVEQKLNISSSDSFSSVVPVGNLNISNNNENIPPSLPQLIPKNTSVMNSPITPEGMMITQTVSRSPSSAIPQQLTAHLSDYTDHFKTSNIEKLSSPIVPSDSSYSSGSEKGASANHYTTVTNTSTITNTNNDINVNNETIASNEMAIESIIPNKDEEQNSISGNTTEMMNSDASSFSSIHKEDNLATQIHDMELSNKEVVDLADLSRIDHNIVDETTDIKKKETLIENIISNNTDVLDNNHDKEESVLSSSSASSLNESKDNVDENKNNVFDKPLPIISSSSLLDSTLSKDQINKDPDTQANDLIEDFSSKISEKSQQDQIISDIGMQAFISKSFDLKDAEIPIPPPRNASRSMVVLNKLEDKLLLSESVDSSIDKTLTGNGSSVTTRSESTDSFGSQAIEDLKNKINKVHDLNLEEARMTLEDNSIENDDEEISFLRKSKSSHRKDSLSKSTLLSMMENVEKDSNNIPKPTIVENDLNQNEIIDEIILNNSNPTSLASSSPLKSYSASSFTRSLRKDADEVDNNDDGYSIDNDSDGLVLNVPETNPSICSEGKLENEVNSHLFVDSNRDSSGAGTLETNLNSNTPVDSVAPSSACDKTIAKTINLNEVQDDNAVESIIDESSLTNSSILPNSSLISSPVEEMENPIVPVISPRSRARGGSMSTESVGSLQSSSVVNLEHKSMDQNSLEIVQENEIEKSMDQNNLEIVQDKEIEKSLDGTSDVEFKEVVNNENQVEENTDGLKVIGESLEEQIKEQPAKQKSVMLTMEQYEYVLNNIPGFDKMQPEQQQQILHHIFKNDLENMQLTQLVNDEDLQKVDDNNDNIVDPIKLAHVKQISVDNFASVENMSDLNPPSTIDTKDTGAEDVSGSSTNDEIINKDEVPIIDRMQYAKTKISRVVKTRAHNKAKANRENDMTFVCARFIIDHVQMLPTDLQKEYCELAIKTLKELSHASNADAQHLLANLYITGIPGFQEKHVSNYNKAFSLYSSAAKMGHLEAIFHKGLCYENGCGVAQSYARSMVSYRKAAMRNHPGAMYRLAMSMLHGELGQQINPKDGVKWLKLACKYADEKYPQALYEFAMLHDKGVHNVVFPDGPYLVDLLTQAAALGYAPAQLKLGEAYEFGKWDLIVNLEMAIYYYGISGANGSLEGMFALGGFYLTGVSSDDPNNGGNGFHLDKNNYEAYRWVRAAAEFGLPKAQFALAYFLETGVGCRINREEANRWYMLAEQSGDKNALERAKEQGRRPMRQTSPDSKQLSALAVGMGGGRRILSASDINTTVNYDLTPNVTNSSGIDPTIGISSRRGSGTFADVSSLVNRKKAPVSVYAFKMLTKTGDGNFNGGMHVPRSTVASFHEHIPSSSRRGSYDFDFKTKDFELNSQRRTMSFPQLTQHQQLLMNQPQNHQHRQQQQQQQYDHNQLLNDENIPHNQINELINDKSSSIASKTSSSTSSSSKNKWKKRFFGIK